MTVKVKPFSKNALIDIKAPKPVIADVYGYAENNVSYTVNEQKYAPKNVYKSKTKEKTKREVIEEPETKTKYKERNETDDIYAPQVYVYTSNAMTEYAKAYLRMLIKLYEETFSEE